jgi:hypothetical protein
VLICPLAVVTGEAAFPGWLVGASSSAEAGPEKAEPTAATGVNFIKDTLLGGNETLYNVVNGVTAVAGLIGPSGPAKAIGKLDDVADAVAAVKGADKAADAAKASKAVDNTSDAASAAKNTNKASDASSAGKTTSKADSCANSFTPDTPVKTGDGEAKPIGEVRPGDQVLTLDPATGERSAQTVTDVITGSDRVVVDVGLADGSVVTTTPGHRLWLPEGREFARADHLEPGDSLSGADGDLVVVESVTLREVPAQPMVNLTVAVTHTFYAGQTPVLVHNCGTTRPTDLKSMAEEVRSAGTHPASRNQRTIAVGQDSKGNLHVRSSNGLDAGQRAARDRLGLQSVPGSGNLHAEEELLRSVPDLERVGTSARMPCGPLEHNCALQLAERGVVVE